MREIVGALRHSTARGEAAVRATAEEMELSVAQVKTALDYYGSYPDEIDELFRWAAGQGRRIVTENIKDFRPLLMRAYPPARRSPRCCW